MAMSRYDDELRQVAADGPGLEAAIAMAGRQLATLSFGTDRRDIARLESYIGEAQRILGRYDEAIAAQRSALARVDATDLPRHGLVYSLRLAEAQRVSGDFVAAEQGFRAGVAATRTNPALAQYEDFALQHLGKCLLDQVRLDEAELALREALAIRRQNGSPDLIASTEAALTLHARRQGDSFRP